MRFVVSSVLWSDKVILLAEYYSLKPRRFMLVPLRNFGSQLIHYHNSVQIDKLRMGRLSVRPFGLFLGGEREGGFLSLSVAGHWRE